MRLTLASLGSMRLEVEMRPGQLDLIMFSELLGQPRSMQMTLMHDDLDRFIANLKDVVRLWERGR